MGETLANPYYEAHADSLMARYESLNFSNVHGDLRDHIPTAPSAVLDVGAGSGRDAAYLAHQGLFVVAVEPSNTMRKLASRLHQDPRISWIDDSLPHLRHVQQSGMRFNLILLSAVWMHIPQKERFSSLSVIAKLLAPSGKVALTLRIGKPEPERAIYIVDVDELLAMSGDAGLMPISVSGAKDNLGRINVTWETVVLQRID